MAEVGQPDARAMLTARLAEIPCDAYTCNSMVSQELAAGELPGRQIADGSLVFCLLQTRHTLRQMPLIINANSSTAGAVTQGTVIASQPLHVGT